MQELIAELLPANDARQWRLRSFPRRVCEADVPAGELESTSAPIAA